MVSKRREELEEYIGELVNIHLKEMNLILGNPSTEDQLVVSNVVEGYVIDVNDYYIHLGVTPNALTKSIAIDQIGVIEIAEDITVMFEMNQDDEDLH